MKVLAYELECNGADAVIALAIASDDGLAAGGRRQQGRQGRP
jgi:hypothetical protein